MSGGRVYLDHNATTPLRPDVLATLSDSGFVGNPSSVHAEGRRARSRVEDARVAVAALVGSDPTGVVFTSGGTEANNLALRPGAMLCLDGRPVTRLVVGATEHPSVLLGHRFPAGQVDLIGVDGEGRLDLERLDAALRASAGEGCLVSVQVANPETGVIQPIGKITAIARRAGAAVHADAVQAAGRVPLDMRALGLDALTLSGHKLGGPMGVGALVLAPGRAGPDLALLRGGGQEGGARAGSENVPAIAGFGAAASAALRDVPREAARLAAFRDAAAREVVRLAPDAAVFGAGAHRLPNTLAFAVPGLSAETALMALDLAGIAVSSGSACSSGKVARSHVLAAMSVPDHLASGAVRLSFGHSSGHEDVARFAAAFASVLRRLYERTRARAA